MNEGIPTTYAGIHFRSRLEARWAAFFNELRWPWEYEPRDFSGWIPDFILLGATPVYIEVKPASKFPPAVAAKIDVTECTDEVLIVGLTPSLPDDEWGDELVVLGWLRELYEGTTWWEPAIVGRWRGTNHGSNPDRLLGFCHSLGHYEDRITGAYDGGCFGEASYVARGKPDPVKREVMAAWAKATNAVQWRPAE